MDFKLYLYNRVAKKANAPAIALPASIIPELAPTVPFTLLTNEAVGPAITSILPIANTEVSALTGVTASFVRKKNWSP